jgi:hypothetical protein
VSFLIFTKAHQAIEGWQKVRKEKNHFFGASEIDRTKLCFFLKTKSI